MEKRKATLDIVSIILNFVIFVGALTCIIIGLISGISFREVEYKGFIIFNFFTILSTLFLGLACLVFGIFKIINIKNKTDSFPHWLSIVKLTATACSFFAFLFCITYIGYKFSFKEIFSGANLFMHLVIPWLGVFSFGVFDKKYSFKIKELFYSLIPPCAYGILYGSLTFSGVWEDVYALTYGWYTILISILCLVVYFGIVFLLQFLNTTVYKIFSIKVTDTAFLDNPLQLYTSKIFKAVFVIAPCAGLAAAFTYTLSWIFNPASFVPEVNVFVILGFDLFVIFYTLLALFLITKSFDKDGQLKRIRLMEGKIVLAVVIPAQWNFLTYVFPTNAFWGYAFFFIILVVFFFDYKLVDVVSAEILISLAISWILNPNLLPPQNDQFILNMTLRVVCLALGCISLHLATYFGGIFLVKQLEKSAEFDPLTLLRTRRFMYRYLSDAFKDKNNEILCIAMIDIDNFKSVNDTYGHLVGDTILKRVADIINSNVNEEDRVFRYGGEEILILFKSGLKASNEKLEKILEILRNTNHEEFNDERKLTISAGLVEKGNYKTYEELIAEADKLLYNAKHNGKDQIKIC